jgi:polysaccharide biosynthesis transport protein
MNKILTVNQSLLAEETGQKPAGPKADGPQNFYVRVLKHQLPTATVSFILILAIAVVYLFTATPIYVATAYMVIDTHQLQLLQDPQEAARSTINVDAGMVSTQIQLLKSQNVSRAVIGKLNLTEDKEFAGPPGFFSALIGKLVELFTPSGPPLTAEEEKLQLLRKVQGKFEDMRTITRVEQSYVMEIDAQSEDRYKAAKIANAIAEAYIDDTLDAKYQETRRANGWLQDRLQELRSQVAAEQKAVVDFRQKNNISYVDTGGGKFYVDTPGKLVNEQQLSELNSQLILAEAATAQDKARYDRIREVMKQDVPDASVAEALNNQVIVKLRGEYLDFAARTAIWSQKYGPDHLSVLAQQSQMREKLRAIRDEMAKIEQSAKSDYEIALAREQSLRTSVKSAMSQSQTANQTQIQLQELESKAQTSRTLHDNFLQHYMETIQQQSFPITEARLVGPADAPLTKSYPKTWLILLLAVVGGSVVSFGVAALRDMLDRVFRSSDQVEEELQAGCLAMVPLLKTPALLGASGSGLAEPKQTQPIRAGTQPILDVALENPFSQFSEALRSVKVANDLASVLTTKKVTGFISSLPGEGKSTVSANYAQLIAHAGTRVVLIDADLRNPALSVSLGGEGIGLVDVLAGLKAAGDAMLVDPRTGLRFLPAGCKATMPHTNELLASNAMKKLITGLQESFDYIVLDLPPLVPVVDARASSNFVDSFICVIQWGSTKIDVVKHALWNAPEIYDRLLGVILNKVDMTAVGRYERYRNRHYYEKYCARYSSPGAA